MAIHQTDLFIGTNIEGLNINFFLGSPVDDIDFPPTVQEKTNPEIELMQEQPISL